MGCGEGGRGVGQGTRSRCARRAHPALPSFTPHRHTHRPLPTQAYFRPELLNRMDEVVVFRPLGQPQVRVLVCLTGVCVSGGADTLALPSLSPAALACPGLPSALTALSLPQVRQIADLELAKTAARMAERSIGLQVRAWAWQAWGWG